MQRNRSTHEEDLWRQRWVLEGCVYMPRTAGVGRQHHKLERLGKSLSQNPEGVRTPRLLTFRPELRHDASLLFSISSSSRSVTAAFGG